MGMNKNEMLVCMLLCYAFPIIIVAYFYENNGSISHIICDYNLKVIILFFMIAMGIFTIFYEKQRNQPFSLYIIIVLLISIYGVLFSYKTYEYHVWFAYLCFLSIIAFMTYHSYTNTSRVLYLLLMLQIFVGIYLYKGTVHFFQLECGMLFVFAVFYLYLHCLRYMKIVF